MFNFVNCQPPLKLLTLNLFNPPGCDCNSIGSTHVSCSETGICECKTGFIGDKCDECGPDRFNYPLCEECNCNFRGVTENFWMHGGCANVPPGELCSCKDGVTGRLCDHCEPGHYDFPNCFSKYWVTLYKREVTL